MWKNPINSDELCALSHSDIQELLGRRILRSSWSPTRALTSAQEEMTLCQKRNITILTLDSHAYPPILKHIYDPPVVLYVWGDPQALASSMFSVVGTRQASIAGIHATIELSSRLVRYGWTLVSGLAFGIDQAAHTGAAQLSRPQVAVLGTQILDVRPKKNRPLAQKILQHGGVLLSEIGPRGHVHAYSFVSRNRIIAGLSHATCIVQAPIKSGALHTAYFAVEQGREVFVHQVGLNKGYEGSIRLYEEGAQKLDLDTIPLAPAPRTELSTSKKRHESQEI